MIDANKTGKIGKNLTVIVIKVLESLVDSIALLKILLVSYYTFGKVLLLPALFLSHYVFTKVKSIIVNKLRRVMDSLTKRSTSGSASLKEGNQDNGFSRPTKFKDLNSYCGKFVFQTIHFTCIKI